MKTVSRAAVGREVQKSSGQTLLKEQSKNTLIAARYEGCQSVKNRHILRFENSSKSCRTTMCNLYSITTNQEAIRALFRVVNRYVGNLALMPGVFPDYPAPVVRNAGAAREMVMMRWGMPPPPRAGGFPVTNIRNTASPHWRG
jgi:hypothetical protein